MGKLTRPSSSATRQHLLQVALKHFAECGYAATSVQDIVDEARVSKPALYYYFTDKAELFQALVDRAHDERYELMRQAAGRGRTVGEKLENVVSAIFEFSLNNRELMRLAFASAFAPAGSAPNHEHCRAKGRRNFEFLRGLISEGQAAGELDTSFSADELTMGIYGQLNSYIIIRLLAPECPMEAGTATRVVRLFLEGAAGHGRRANGAPPRRLSSARRVNGATTR